MVGYISEAVATALKTWTPLKKARIFPVRATEGASVVVNTPLPAIAIHVNGDDGQGNTYLGGGIRLYFELSLYVLLPINNTTFSPDKGLQAETLDTSEEVLRCMELTTALDYAKQKYDWNMQFDSMSTETSYGTQNAISVVIDVHKIVYKCDVEFNTNLSTSDGYAILEKIIYEYENIETQ